MKEGWWGGQRGVVSINTQIRFYQSEDDDDDDDDDN